MNIKVQEDRKPAALYARVSSDRQDVDLSISAQLRALRDYADKNGYLVVREYVDEAESGRIADRPQFRRMLNDAGKPSSPFEEILVWKFSRFTRKREHAVAFKSYAPQARSPGHVHHRTLRRLSHRQADGGHHRERGRVLLGKSRAGRHAGNERSRLPGFLGDGSGPIRIQQDQGEGWTQGTTKAEAGPQDGGGRKAHVSDGGIG